MPLYRDLVVGKKPLQVPEVFTLFDVIGKLDQKYFEKIRPKLSPTELKRILFDSACKTLLQVLWNSKEKRFYEDVIFHARKSFSSRESLPVRENLKFILPDKAYIILGP